VALGGPLAGGETIVEGVTTVVDGGSAQAADELYRQLDALPDGPRVHVVGDANAPRTAFEAVYEGRMAGAFLGAFDTAAAERVRYAH
ncbi:NADH:flavin oxidoreductase, partial [Micromonospora aurantiaca]